MTGLRFLVVSSCLLFGMAVTATPTPLPRLNPDFAVQGCDFLVMDNAKVLSRNQLTQVNHAAIVAKNTGVKIRVRTTVLMNAPNITTYVDRLRKRCNPSWNDPQMVILAVATQANRHAIYFGGDWNPFILRFQTIDKEISPLFSKHRYFEGLMTSLAEISMVRSLKKHIFYGGFGGNPHPSYVQPKIDDLGTIGVGQVGQLLKDDGWIDDTSHETRPIGQSITKTIILVLIGLSGVILAFIACILTRIRRRKARYLAINKDAYKANNVEVMETGPDPECPNCGLGMNTNPQACEVVSYIDPESV